MFENDKQIQNLLQCAEIFTSLFYEGLEASCKDFSPDSPKELHDGVLDLKGNKIPKGMVSLERIFDRKDGYVKQGEKETPIIQNSSEYERINIVTEEDPKFINLGKCCSEEERRRFISLLIECKYVFAWC